MVGACADWYAVVALFRRPLGLPIPTSIRRSFPTTRSGSGGALGRFITNNFLTAPVLNERLGRVDVDGSVARWLENPRNSALLGNYLADQLPRIVEALPGRVSAKPSASSRNKRSPVSRRRRRRRNFSASSGRKARPRR